MPSLNKTQCELTSGSWGLKGAKMPHAEIPAGPNKAQLVRDLDRISKSKYSSTQLGADAANAIKIAIIPIQHAEVPSNLKVTFKKGGLVEIDLSPKDSKNPGQYPHRFVSLTTDMEAKTVKGTKGADGGIKLFDDDAKKLLDQLIKAASKQISEAPKAY